MANQLRSGVLLSYVNMALGMLIPFFYTPVMLGMLGQAEYGLFSLSSSVVSYLSLLSFGFGNTVIRYLSKYRAEENQDAFRKTFGFFILLYCGFGALVLICGIALAMNTGAIFEEGLTEPERAKMTWLVLIMTVSSALAFPVSAYSSVVVSYERFVFKRAVDIVVTVAAPLANLVALFLGYASVGMALAGLAIQIATLPVNAIYCHRKLKIKPKLGFVSKSLFREMLGVSLFNMLGAVVDMLFWSTDKVILGMLVSSTAVAVYNIGSVFNGMLVGLSTSITGVLAPKVTGMVVKEASSEELTELFVRVGRLQFLIVGLVVTGFTVFGRQFIDIWAGAEYTAAYSIALLTIYPLAIPLIQNTGITIVVAQNKQEFRSLVYLAIAIVNVISTWLVVPHFGGIGAALCSAVSYLLGQGLIMNMYYWKVTKIDIGLFWRNILKMAAAPATMLCAGLVVASAIDLRSWPALLVGVPIYTAVYGFLAYRFSMNGYERDVLLMPLRGLANRLGNRSI